MSEETNTQKGEKQPVLSAEEIKKRQDATAAWYKSQLPYLKVQREYEEHCAGIEKARFESMFYTMRQAQLMAGPPEEPPQPENPEGGEKKETPGAPEEGTAKRTLKTDK